MILGKSLLVSLPCCRRLLLFRTDDDTETDTNTSTTAVSPTMAIILFQERVETVHRLSLRAIFVLVVYSGIVVCDLRTGLLCFCRGTDWRLLVAASLVKRGGLVQAPLLRGPRPKDKQQACMKRNNAADGIRFYG
jgi:hypothetical protein